MKCWLPVLAVCCLLLTGCGQAAVSPELAVFSAQPEDRSALLYHPADAPLWEALALEELTVEEPAGDAITIGEESWLAVPATLRGIPYTLWLCATPDDRWQLDLTSSFGINAAPAEQWGEQPGLFTVRVTATLGEELPEAYAEESDNRFPVLLWEETGEPVVAVAPLDTEDGMALYRLLSGSGEHRLLLRLRAMQGGDEPLLRVVAFCGEGWLDAEAILRAQCEELLSAARSGKAESVAALLNSRNITVTNQNGDGLLYLALLSGDAETVALLAQQGCTDENHNYYRTTGTLTPAEEQDREALIAAIRQRGGAAGCIAGELDYQFTAVGNAAALGLYLDHYPSDWSVPQEERTALLSYYGAVEEAEVNLLDIAIMADDPATAEVLLSHGAPASQPLRQALREDPTAFSRGMLAVLGGYRYFGELDDILADYAAFRQSYRQQAGNACARFEKLYNAYLDAAAAEDFFQAAAIMDSGLLRTIVGQLEAVQLVETPQTDAISHLWDMMFEYADMMDTAGWYYKRIARSTYSVTRNYQKYMFELRLSQGQALYNEFLTATATYDWLLEKLV